MIVFLIYVAIFVTFYAAVKFARRKVRRHDFTSLKTVTFGDESAVRPDRTASIISIFTIFVIWGAFTGSEIVPFHVPGPFKGTQDFTYTLKNQTGETATGKAEILVYAVGSDPNLPKPGQAVGFAPGVVGKVPVWRSGLIRTHAPDGTTIVAVNGQTISSDRRA